MTGTGAQGPGVAGTSSDAAFSSIIGRHGQPGGTGVVGYASANAGLSYGVWGRTSSPQGAAVYGDCPNISNGLAGLFSGNVIVEENLTISHTMTAAQKLFRIDHPLDPANKFLLHSVVESSEMINVYSGNVTTDSNGRAFVLLPKYVQTLNNNFRYHLTVIGIFAQAIVAKKLENDSFVIETDKPNVKISWQVTGTRQDPYANAHKLIVEQDKSAAERGLFVHPELYNQPPANALVIAFDRSTSVHIDHK